MQINETAQKMVTKLHGNKKGNIHDHYKLHHNYLSPREEVTPFSLLYMISVLDNYSEL